MKTNMAKVILDQKLSVSEYNIYPKILRNWLALSKELSKIEDENIILRLLRVEIGNKKRPEILKRLYARYSVLRKDREIREMYAFAFQEGKYV